MFSKASETLKNCVRSLVGPRLCLPPLGTPLYGYVCTESATHDHFHARPKVPLILR